MVEHGRFCWYELNARDPDTAAAFYGAVLGWTAEDAGMPGVDYRYLAAGDARQGGLMRAEADGPAPGWIGYVAVDDCDATAAAAGAAGASIHVPAQDIPGVGRFAILGDPDGVLVAVIQPAPQAEGSPAAPHAAWHELHACDGAAAWAFYAPLFRWAEQMRMPMGPAGDYIVFGRADVAEGIGGLFDDRQAARPYWQFYHPVDALDAALARVAEAGGTIRHAPTQVPGGAWVAQCSDPEGAPFGLHAAAR